MFRGKFGGKIARNSRLGGIFPGERKSRLGYVLKTSGHACVQHLYSSAPPGGETIHYVEYLFTTVSFVHYSETYEEGRRKEKLAEDTSNLDETEEEDIDSGRSKRK